MTMEIQPALDTITAQWTWVKPVLITIGGMRLVAKGFSKKLQLALEDRIEIITRSKTVEDDQRVQRILESRTYGWISFVVDLLFSVKLPRALVSPDHQTPTPTASYETKF